MCVPPPPPLPIYAPSTPRPYPAHTAPLRHPCASLKGLRVALGPSVILMYTLQGLFHPARRVRETFWKVYNNLYIYAADALTPAYPMVEDDGMNTYRRTHMELMI